MRNGAISWTDPGDPGTDKTAPGTRKQRIKNHIRKAFGPSFLFFAALALSSAAFAYWIGGQDAMERALSQGGDLINSILPRLGAAFLIAGFVRALISQELIARWLGGRSGIRGMVIAEFAGAITPGGPVAAFSMIAALKLAGADRGVLVAFAAGWSLLGFQRLMLWEVPLLGTEFLAIRYASSILLPIVAGLIARKIPIDLTDPKEVA